MRRRALGALLQFDRDLPSKDTQMRQATLAEVRKSSEGVFRRLGARSPPFGHSRYRREAPTRRVSTPRAVTALAMSLLESAVSCEKALEARYLLGFLSTGVVARDAEELLSQRGELLWEEHEDLLEDADKISSVHVTMSGGLVLSLHFLFRLSSASVRALVELFRLSGNEKEAKILEDCWRSTTKIAERRESLASRSEALFYSAAGELYWARCDGSYVMAINVASAVRAKPEVFGCAEDERDFVSRVTNAAAFKRGLLAASSALTARLGSSGAMPYFDQRRLLADFLAFRLFLLLCGGPISAELAAEAAVREGLLDMGDVASALDCVLHARRRPPAQCLLGLRV